MRIRIAYYGESRFISGKESESIEVDPGIQVCDIIGRLAEMYGKKMSWLLLNENGTPRRSVILAVNDVAVDPESYDAMEDNDLLAILPAVSGG